MDNKKLLIISAILFGAGILVIALTFLFKPKESNIPVPEPYIPPAPIIEETKPIAPVYGDKATLERYARIVAMRIGTFKNGDLSGVETLKPIFEPNVFNALKRVRSQSLQKEDKGVEAVISTVNFTNTAIKDNNAEVTVIGQQIRNSEGNSVSKDLNLKLEFTKGSEGWIISKFSF